jgi:S-adenosylmethionine synthetase
MRNLQFLTDATLTSEDLAGIKGGKRTTAVVTTQRAVELLAARGAKSVLYNGKVYSISVNEDGKACMVMSATDNTCVEW